MAPAPPAWHGEAMAGWTIRATNLKALRHFEWSPSGVCALVGPNGSGKTTALKLVHFASTALRQGTDEALRVFGAGPLRFIDAGLTSVPKLELAMDSLSWSVAFEANGFLAESASRAPAGIFARARPPETSTWVHDPSNDTRVSVRHQPNQLVLAQVDARMGEELNRLKGLVEGSALFFRPELALLRAEGCTVSNVLALDAQAKNLFTVLRNWRDQSAYEDRFSFVMEGMAECFPGFRRLDFVGWGPRQGAELPQPGSAEKLQPSDWSDGFLSVLSLLTAAASVERGVLAIDEVENSLHPELIVRVIELLREWSRRKSVVVLLATHSPVVLDQFRAEPECVYVMQPGAEQTPVALDTLKKRDWLQHFSIGDLYSHGEVGAPRSE